MDVAISQADVPALVALCSLPFLTTAVVAIVTCIRRLRHAHAGK